MLRYVEQVGLLEPGRSAAGYRLFGPGELQRLRTLRELLDDHDVDLGNVAFASRMRREHDLRDAVEDWLRSEAERPDDVPAGDWLRWEQDKHSKLLATAGQLEQINQQEDA